MIRDEIIAMAKEAGFAVHFHGFEAEPAVFGRCTSDTLLRFAALVAAREREACAQVCDAKAHEVRLWCNESNVIACATAIRARGTQ